MFLILTHAPDQTSAEKIVRIIREQVPEMAAQHISVENQPTLYRTSERFLVDSKGNLVRRSDWPPSTVEEL